jgi:hypothetical protein
VECGSHLGFENDALARAAHLQPAPKRVNNVDKPVNPPLKRPWTALRTASWTSATVEADAVNENG